MTKLFKVTIISLVLFLGNAYADHGIATGDVTLIQFYQGHTGVLIQHSNMANTENCGRSDFLILPDTNSHFKEVYSLLLTAQTSNKKVGLILSGCSNDMSSIRSVILPKQ